MNRLAVILIVLAFALPGSVAAQEIVPDTVTTMKARVLEILSQEQRAIPGTDVETTYQSIRVEVLDGVQKGEEILVDNDYLEMEVGDVFYLTRTVNTLDGTDYYVVSDPDRLPALGILFALFVLVIVAFGGKQGIRGLLSLVASLFFIVFMLLPGIMNGYPPIVVAVGVSSLIIIIGSYVTHGFTRTTSTAVLGMVVTVTLTGLLAYFAIPFASLSGFTSEETVYLNMNARGAIDLAGLLIGGILIGNTRGPLRCSDWAIGSCRRARACG